MTKKYYRYSVSTTGSGDLYVIIVIIIVMIIIIIIIIIIITRNFSKRAVISNGIDELWAADLVEMQKLSTWNKLKV